MDLMADILRFSLLGLVVVVAMSVLYGIEVNEHFTNGDRHGSHPRAFFSCNVASHRRLVAEQVPVMNIAIFVLYGLVMITMPPWSLREVSPKSLVVMIIVVFGLCGLVKRIHSHDTWWSLTPKSWLSWWPLFCVLCVAQQAVVWYARCMLCVVPWCLDYHWDLWEVVVNRWWLKQRQFSRCLFCDVPVTVLYVIAILERRCEQVPVMNIDIFALYGLVMNPTPPWSLRDVASETLFDMIFLKCSWRALLHLFCVVSWWFYHHDSCRSHSWCYLFREGVPAIFHCNCFTVWLLDT